MTSKRIIWRHESEEIPDNKQGLIILFLSESKTSAAENVLVIDEGIHEQSLIYEFLPLGLFIGQVSVVVIGDDDAV